MLMLTRLLTSQSQLSMAVDSIPLCLSPHAQLFEENLLQVPAWLWWQDKSWGLRRRAQEELLQRHLYGSVRGCLREVGS
ncbi:hypothetical protein SKAU_G00052920 [Synaphobranchus kaupii]|uniref:Uncharacterized protein n=1 Tax=Synaphobranchus kaupii TaxID=118154 RepID=A0A9Q1G4E6_SYNKA|nr:hypothetical protein SKAU_G00052920 [Synaphobranchus kaupii]